MTRKSKYANEYDKYDNDQALDPSKQENKKIKK